MSDGRILIVDGDESSAAHLEAALTSLGYGLCAAVGCGFGPSSRPRRTTLDRRRWKFHIGPPWPPEAAAETSPR